MPFYKLEQGYKTRWSNNKNALIDKAKKRDEDWLITDSAGVFVAARPFEATQVYENSAGMAISFYSAVMKANEVFRQQRLVLAELCSVFITGDVEDE